MTHDRNGTPLKVGDDVKENNTIHRVVAVGVSIFVGYICVTGVLGWVKATRFEKVTG